MELNRKCHNLLEFGSKLEILWKKHTFFSEKMCVFLIKIVIFGHLGALKGYKISAFCKTIWNSIESVIIGYNLDQS